MDDASLVTAPSTDYWKDFGVQRVLFRCLRLITTLARALSYFIKLMMVFVGRLSIDYRDGVEDNVFILYLKVRFYI